MKTKIGIPKEIIPNEHRVAVAPKQVQELIQLGFEILFQEEAFLDAGFKKEDYSGCCFLNSNSEIYQQADIILKIQPPSLDEVIFFKEKILLICFLFPHKHELIVEALKQKKATVLALEKLPRITRAQMLDVLSSQATVAGYRAAIIGAEKSPVFYPMLSTAAGTIHPAKVIVIGAGVAGLQAIATSKRLGAQVEAYDIRSSAREQVQSLGAKMIELPFSAESTGGYGRVLSEEELKQQQIVLLTHLKKANVIILTAAIPGQPAPKIITTEMIEHLKSGTVIIDAVADDGGNCELTQPGKCIQHSGVTIDGPLLLASQLAKVASELFSKNVTYLLKLLFQDHTINYDTDVDMIHPMRVIHHE